MPDLLRKPTGSNGLVHDITPETAGWAYVGFQLYRLKAGETASGALGDQEAILVYVEGKGHLTGGGRDWGVLGDRMDVFEKTAPHCVYLPGGSDWSVTATTDLTLAVCLAPAKGDFRRHRSLRKGSS